MAAARTRAALVAERNEAIREVLGERGQAEWRRRLVVAVFHSWKGLYMRGAISKLETNHRLRLRQQVEDQVRHERKEAGDAIAGVRAKAEALATQLAHVEGARRDSDEQVTLTLTLTLTLTPLGSDERVTREAEEPPLSALGLPLAPTLPLNPRPRPTLTLTLTDEQVRREADERVREAEERVRHFRELSDSECRRRVQEVEAERLQRQHAERLLAMLPDQVHDALTLTRTFTLAPTPTLALAPTLTLTLTLTRCSPPRPQRRRVQTGWSRRPTGG